MSDNDPRWQSQPAWKVTMSSNLFWRASLLAAPQVCEGTIDLKYFDPRGEQTRIDAALKNGIEISCKDRVSQVLFAGEPVKLKLFKIAIYETGGFLFVKCTTNLIFIILKVWLIM